MESEAAKLLMTITNLPDDDLSVKNRFSMFFAGNPVIAVDRRPETIFKWKSAQNYLRKHKKKV